jgi:methionyl-tRNA formyltransferase
LRDDEAIQLDRHGAPGAPRDDRRFNDPPYTPMPAPLPLKLGFMGSDPIALPLLDWLVGEGSAFARIAVVYTQPDRPAGRGQKVEAGPIRRWAADHGLPVRQPEKLAQDECAWLATQEADLMLVMAYGQILRDEFIILPRLGTLNLHASILPCFRGASPIQTAVACGVRETGVSLMRVVKRLDAGPVAEVERVLVTPLDTAREVEAKLAPACVPLLGRALPRLRAGSLVFTAQDETRANYCRRLVKEDGQLDFSAPAATLAARINGLFPWPSCAVEINGVAVKLGLADAVAHADLPGGRAMAPGLVAGVAADGLLVVAGDGILRLRKLQRPGGKMLAASEFLRGFTVPAGTVLASRSMPPLVSSRPFPRSAGDPRT